MRLANVRWGWILAGLGILMLMAQIWIISSGLIMAIEKLWPLLMIGLGVCIMSMDAKKAKLINLTIWTIITVAILVYGYWGEKILLA